MSKIKNYIMDSVEKQVDKITDNYLAGNIDLNTAENKIEDIDNLEMVMEKHHVGEHLFYAKEDYEKEHDLKMKTKFI